MEQTSIVTQISPIFVIGTPRSGTTLTAKILGRHQNLFMPGETHFIDDIYALREQFGDLPNRSTIDKVAQRLHDHYHRYYELEDQERIAKLYPKYQDLAEELYGLGTYADIYNAFMTIQMRGTEKKRWGNNVPRDIFNVHDIKEMFPRAKFVVCVRDIRGFLLSYKGKWEVVDEELHVSRLKRLYHPVVTSYLWKSSMRQLSKLGDIVPASDMCIVRYEDLTTDTENVVRKVCKVIDETYEDAMLDVNTHNSSSSDASTGIFSTSVNLWRSQLSSEEVSIGQFIGRQELRDLGYDAVPVDVNILKLLGIWLSAPIALWNGLRANKEMRGPLVPYLVKRISTLVK